MGYVKEPAGVDFVVDPTPITTAERKRISDIIAHYKATGKKIVIPKSTIKGLLAKTSKKRDLA